MTVQPSGDPLFHDSYAVGRWQPPAAIPPGQVWGFQAAGGAVDGASPPPLELRARPQPAHPCVRIQGLSDAELLFPVPRRSVRLKLPSLSLMLVCLGRGLGKLSWVVKAIRHSSFRLQEPAEML